ncbi:TIGR03943 family putative permease subunit [Neobacillus vireti]|uniref:Nucleic acid binding domain protein n=1 Tax=Neobacillus vireti LMG 21834 TaxID=1131730 RepID=A0AB94IMC3_9BACI|nr:TIGR03943 family protein [Neobacillus vireti]ETI68152.1 nucleic acid binding domain protein [Neobacillus vireti LMG 21834]KLT15891.1 DNA-binding protein [Neobacillus vireti]
MKRMNSEKKTYHHLIRGIIMIGFMLLLLKLLLTNNITFFIAPKMNGFIYFTLFVFLLIGVLLIFRGTSEEKTHYDCECEGDHSYPKSKLMSLFLYSIFIIPITTGLLFADHVLGSSVAQNRTLKLGADTQDMANIQPVKKKSSSSNPSQPDSTPDSSSADMPEPLTQNEYSSLASNLLQAPSINVTDNAYVPMVNIIQENLEKIIGKTITIKGFIYREKNFFQDQIVIARYGITCCVADASVYGMMAKGDVSGLPKDKWIQVTGTIDQTIFDGAPIPIINIQDYKMISVPKQPYVYDVGVRIE